MNERMLDTLTRRFKILGLEALIAVAALLLAACGSAAEQEPASAPTATEPSAATGEATPVSAGATAASAKVAPTFELPNAKGETISLASYAGDKNVVLVFYRGFW